MGYFPLLGLSVNAVEPVPEVYVAGTLLTRGKAISDGVDGSLTSKSADGKALTLDKFDVNHTAAPVNGSHASDSYIMINPGGQGGGNFTIMVADLTILPPPPPQV